VYNARGARGCLVPNQYWVAGMFAPVPILGRYYLDYDYEWQPPDELGRSCASRMVKEIMLDNTGVCRFHRGWAESLLPEVLVELLGVDGPAHHLALARELEADNATLPWQTERVVDMVATYLVKVRDDGPPEPALDAWIDRFARDKAGAARAYWEEIRRGFREGVGAA
jgi:glyceraldehyde-3-phosphate dehydrogenase (ferredoxin)